MRICKKFCLFVLPYIRHEKTEQTFKVTKMLIHPDYNPHITDNDVTLLKLDRPALLTPDVQLACLPEAGYQLPQG